MKLIGMLDSPYVRRVAISLQLLDLRFEHQALSVFRTFAEFQKLNPVVKAPTLICDDGTVLMDSTLILDYAEALARPRSLLPATSTERAAALASSDSRSQPARRACRSSMSADCARLKSFTNRGSTGSPASCSRPMTDSSRRLAARRSRRAARRSIRRA